MSVTNLEYLFKPKSVAVIGATNDPQNAGNIVMRNIMAGFYARKLFRPGQQVTIAGESGVLRAITATSFRPWWMPRPRTSRKKRKSCGSRSRAKNTSMRSNANSC